MNEHFFVLLSLLLHPAIGVTVHVLSFRKKKKDKMIIKWQLNRIESINFVSLSSQLRLRNTDKKIKS